MEEEIRLRNLYPFHFYVFQNKFEALKEELEMKEDLEDTIDMQDIHGRTPLMLAIVLRHIECAELLLEYGADANTQNKGMIMKIK
jgi:ankyrin repeat protein